MHFMEANPGAIIEAKVMGRPVSFYARDLAAVAGAIEQLDGTSLTLGRKHAGTFISTTSSSPVHIMIPPAAQTQFPIPTVITVAQMGTGQVTFVAARNVTLHTPETLSLKKQYAAVMLMALDTDVWLLAGNLAPAS